MISGAPILGSNIEDDAYDFNVCLFLQLPFALKELSLACVSNLTLFANQPGMETAFAVS
jgi:hypothetical protein